MFTILNSIKKEWKENPDNDYYFAEISGLRRALNYVVRAESREYTALDEWAQSIQKRK